MTDHLSLKNQIRSLVELYNGISLITLTSKIFSTVKLTIPLFDVLREIDVMVLNGEIIRLRHAVKDENNIKALFFSKDTIFLSVEGSQNEENTKIVAGESHRDG